MLRCASNWWSAGDTRLPLGGQAQRLLSAGRDQWAGEEPRLLATARAPDERHASRHCQSRSVALKNPGVSGLRLCAPSAALLRSGDTGLHPQPSTARKHLHNTPPRSARSKGRRILAFSCSVACAGDTARRTEKAWLRAQSPAKPSLCRFPCIQGFEQGTDRHSCSTGFHTGEIDQSKRPYMAKSQRRGTGKFLGGTRENWRKVCGL